MAIYSFNHVYELFAGMTSALIGVDAVQEYFSSKFKEKTDFISSQTAQNLKKIENVKLELEILQKEVVDKLKIAMPLIIDEFAKIKSEIAQIYDSSTRISNSVINPNNEKAFVIKMVARFSMFSFLFSLFLLILGGIQESEYFSNSALYSFLCVFEIIFIIMLFLGVIFYDKNNISINKRTLKDFIRNISFGSIFFIFIIILVFSVSISIFLPFDNIVQFVAISVIKDIKIGLVIISAAKFLMYFLAIFICAFPFFAIAYRYYMYINNLYKIVESELLENKKRIDTIIAKITSQVTSPEPN